MTSTENPPLMWTCHNCFKQWLTPAGAADCCHQGLVHCGVKSRGGSACLLPGGHQGNHQDSLGHGWVLAHGDDGRPLTLQAAGWVRMEYRTTALVEAARVQDFLDDGWTVDQ